MTLNEAIKYVEAFELCKPYPMDSQGVYKTARKIVIDAAKRQPCGDAINKQVAIEAFKREAEKNPQNYTPDDAIATLNALSPVCSEETFSRQDAIDELREESYRGIQNYSPYNAIATINEL